MISMAIAMTCVILGDYTTKSGANRKILDKSIMSAMPLLMKPS